MGLDMYLTKKTYIGGSFEHRKVKGKVEITIGEKPVEVKLNRINYIEEQIGCWRKANHIHKWFVENVQEGIDDCKSYYVSLDNLKKLLETLNTVIEHTELIEGKIVNGYSIKDGEKIPIIEDGKYIKDNSKAKELLPTSQGFFFGGTDYDEYYYQDLLDTKKIIEEAIKEKGTAEIYYSSSW